MARKRRRRGKIRIKKSIELKHKNDATRVSKPDTTGLTKAPTRVPSNGAVFKIRVRKR